MLKLSQMLKELKRDYYQGREPQSKIHQKKSEYFYQLNVWFSQPGAVVRSVPAKDENL